MIIVYCRVDDTLEKNICNSFEYEDGPRNNVHYLSGSENKAWKKIQACTGLELMTPAILVQRSINWANKPTWSWLLRWFQINPWSDE